MTASIRRILLVEDDPNDVELTLTALTDHAMVNEVDVANDGAEALDYLFCRGNYAGRPTGVPAVILLDIKMPKVDGIEVLRQLKQDSQLRVIPVVMLTSSREEARPGRELSARGQRICGQAGGLHRLHRCDQAGRCILGSGERTAARPAVPLAACHEAMNKR